MKIVICTPYFYPKIGGTEQYVLTIAGGLVAKGCEVVVITSGSSQSKVVQKHLKGIKIYYLPYQFTLSNTPISFRWSKQIKEIIEEEKPNVVNAHSPVPFMADVALRVTGQTPVLFTYHAGSMHKNKLLPDLIIDTYEKFILPKSLARATEVATSYPTFIEKITHGTKKVNHVTPGIDTSLFKPKKSIHKQYDVLYVGRIERSSAWKGIGTLLKALANLADEMPSIKACFVGDGDAVDDFKEISNALKIRNNVSFIGRKDSDELPDIYNSSKLLVLPSESESESFGIVLIEAMACGIPVIGSRIGGIPNVISNGENGFLVNPKDASHLAQVIKQLVSDPLLANSLGLNGLKHVKTQYDITKVIDANYQIMQRLADQSKAISSVNSTRN